MVYSVMVPQLWTFLISLIFLLKKKDKEMIINVNILGHWNIELKINNQKCYENFENYQKTPNLQSLKIERLPSKN